MPRPGLAWFLLCSLATPGYSRLEVAVCGWHPERWKEELHLHRQAAAKRRLFARQARPAVADIGHIAILEDSDGVVARRNEFNLDQRTLRFTPSAPSAARYRFTLADNTYDAAAAEAGEPLRDLADDDYRNLTLPFPFPFFGRIHQSVFINSDGNLTFGAGDKAISERSLGRLVAGPPRIAGLFMDLDPSRVRDSVRVLSRAERFVVSWVAVPEYSDFGIGLRQTFQIRLYPDGRIEFAWSGIGTQDAVVGIAPGALQGSSAVVSFLSGSSQEYAAAVAERFGGREEIDIATAAQKFYETHDDAYDYLVFYNAMGLPAAAGAVAYETTTRNNRTGYGDPIVDVGREFGSPARLQAILNLGPLSQYPRDPNEFVPARRTSRDTPLTVIGHEAGHLFLAFASIRDPADSRARPMLGYQSAHWAFTFNSEASLLEGNRIRDNGPGVAPRFTTTGAAEGYAPLDQYLMGLRAPEEVPPTFLVTGAGPQFAVRLPEVGVNFDGQRLDVRVEDIIAAEGRRTPDHTVAQRRFRFAVILVVRAGTTPSPSDIEQVDRYRREFEAFFRRASSDRAVADTSLKLALRLSAFPASGVVAGRSAPATLSVQRAVQAPLSIALTARNGSATVPTSVTIPAGATSVAFNIGGARAGVDEITAEPADSRYDTAVARVQVAASLEELKMTVVSGDQQRYTSGQALPDPVVLRVRDVNDLPYPGLRISAVSSPDGTVEPPFAVTDADGQVSFRWTPVASAVLSARLEDSAVAASVRTLAPRTFGAPVNAASYAPPISPGALATIFGANLTTARAAATSFPWPQTLAGAQVLIDGRPAPLLYASETQINFLVPPDASVGTVNLTILADGLSSSRAAELRLVSPGIFFDAASGFGAILHPGTTQTTRERPAERGGFVEIYTTGLGPVRDGVTTLTPEVAIGGAKARVVYSGLAPGYLGLYQVNVEVPGDAPSGQQPLVLVVNGGRSNSVTIGVR